MQTNSCGSGEVVVKSATDECMRKSVALRCVRRGHQDPGSESLAYKVVKLFG